MADRTVRVRLEAITSAYQRQMEQAAKSTQQLVDRAGGLEQLGGRMQNVGRKMTVGVTLPIVAAGGAAVKMATDFETSFASLVGLAGVPAEEVDNLKESVLSLAGETGRAPQELAEALYFAASAGLDAAGAMDAVEVAAKGAAAGLGDTTDIVGLVASAVASYGEESINAAEAVDILTATIREGRADPDELASTLGRILPIASQLGVSFDEVGGTVAYLSNVFGDTNRTVTATQGLFVKLVSPSKQGRKALEDMGTSVEELQSAIDKDGLLGALELLREKGFAGNAQALRSLFDDIEGYQAALALLNDESGSLADVMAATADNAGSMEEALGVMAETAGFKNAQAFAQLQTALIQVGDVLVPLVADVASFAGTLLEAFNSLPGPAQTALVAFAGLLAITGPLASIGGKLVSNWHTIGRGFDRAAVGAYDLAGGMGKIARAGAVVGILYGVGQALDATVNRLERADLNGLQRALLDLSDAGSIGGEAASAFGDDFGKLASAIERVAAPSTLTQADHAINTISTMGGLLGRGKGDLAEAKAVIDDLDQALAGLAATDPDSAAAALEAVRRALSPEDFDRLLPQLDNYRSALDGVDVAARTGAGGVEELGGATEEMIPPVDEAIQAQEELEDAIKGVTNAIRSQLDPLFAAQDALDGHRDAQDDLKAAQLEAVAAQAELNEVTAAHGPNSKEASDAAWKFLQAQGKVDDANRKVVRSALDVAAASAELKMRVDDGSVSLDAAEQQLRDWVDQGLITEQQAWETAEQLRGTAGAADDLGGKNIAIPVGLTGYARVIAQLDELSRRAGTPLIFNASIRGREAVADRKVGGPVPGAHGQMVPINAHGGEYVLSADVVDAIKNGRPSAGLPALASTAGRPSVSGGGGPVSYRQDIQLVVRDPHEAMTELRAAHRMQQLSHS